MESFGGNNSNNGWSQRTIDHYAEHHCSENLQSEVLKCSPANENNFDEPNVFEDADNHVTNPPPLPGRLRPTYRIPRVTRSTAPPFHRPCRGGFKYFKHLDCYTIAKIIGTATDAPVSLNR
jgi:hypothetical protein